MELAIAIRRLLRHRVLVSLGLVLAFVAGILSVYRIDGTSLVARGGVRHSTASTEILVDSPSSALANLQQDVTPLQSLAETLANVAPSYAVMKLIGQRAGLLGSQLYAQGPVDQSLPRTMLEPTDLQRNVELTGEQAPFRLQFNVDPNIPEIGVAAQAPTTAEAVKLANATYLGLNDYVSQLQQAGAVRPSDRVVLRELGQAHGAVDAPSAAKSLALLAFVGVFVFWCVMILVSERFVEIWRRSAGVAPAPDPESHKARGVGMRFRGRKPARTTVPSTHDAPTLTALSSADGFAAELSQAKSAAFSHAATAADRN